MDGLSSIDEIKIRLRHSRLALKLTQQRLADITGLSVQAWNNAERGRSRIGLDNAIRLVRGTGLTLDWIYLGIKTGLPLGIAEALSRIEADPPPIKARRKK